MGWRSNSRSHSLQSRRRASQRVRLRSLSRASLRSLSRASRHKRSWSRSSTRSSSRWRSSSRRRRRHSSSRSSRWRRGHRDERVAGNAADTRDEKQLLTMLSRAALSSRPPRRNSTRDLESRKTTHAKIAQGKSWQDAQNHDHNHRSNSRDKTLEVSAEAETAAAAAADARVEKVKSGFRAVCKFEESDTAPSGQELASKFITMSGPVRQTAEAARNDADSMEVAYHVGGVPAAHQYKNDILKAAFSENPVSKTGDLGKAKKEIESDTAPSKGGTASVMKRRHDLRRRAESEKLPRCNGHTPALKDVTPSMGGEYDQQNANSAGDGFSTPASRRASDQPVHRMTPAGAPVGSAPFRPRLWRPPSVVHMVLPFGPCGPGRPLLAGPLHLRMGLAASARTGPAGTAPRYHSYGARRKNPSRSRSRGHAARLGISRNSSCARPIGSE